MDWQAHRGMRKTIPLAFVGTIPDIADQQYLYQAEGYLFWAQFIGPILLKDRPPRICFKAADVNNLKEMVNRWVAEYERLYYQYRDD
ncbi:hypothetical protein FRC12_010182 [Ceratobasidium sp. 428]|nr:hypothetical protein FRC12_010182 [Ceratobasidium sp. 428]